jgi:hypothetical protein
MALAANHDIPKLVFVLCARGIFNGSTALAANQVNGLFAFDSRQAINHFYTSQNDRSAYLRHVDPSHCNVKFMCIIPANGENGLGVLDEKRQGWASRERSVRD